MKQSKALLITILLIALLTFSQTGAPLYTTIEYDPPSIFNNGSGGISRFYIEEVYRRRVEVIYSLENLPYYDSNKYLLLIIGPDSDVDGYEEVIAWVGRGGVAMIMDELNHTTSFLHSIGVYQGTLYRTVDIGVCNIGNSTINVVFNVFREIRADNTKAQLLCVVDGNPVALLLPYDNGTFIVFGDSSLIINNVMDTVHSVNNTLLIDLLIGGRGIVVYEGSRIYSTIEARVIAHALNTIPILMNMVIAYLVGSDGIRRIIAFLSIICLVAIYTINRFGISRKLHIGLKKVVKDREGYSVLANDIAKGVSVWLKEIER